MGREGEGFSGARGRGFWRGERLEVLAGRESGGFVGARGREFSRGRRGVDQ